MSGTALGAGDRAVNETKIHLQGANTLVRGNRLEIKIQNNREVKYLVIAHNCIPWTWNNAWLLAGAQKLFVEWINTGVSKSSMEMWRTDYCVHWVQTGLLKSLLRVWPKLSEALKHAVSVTSGHSLFWELVLYFAKVIILPVIFRSNELSIEVSKVPTWHSLPLPQTQNTKF